MFSLLLHFFLFNHSCVSSSALDYDFVTWRGHLTKLLTTPYETREGWQLAATKFNGTIYISEVETEAARVERENRPERNKEMMYWGYKFEQYTCAGKSSRFLCFVGSFYCYQERGLTDA